MWVIDAPFKALLSVWSDIAQYFFPKHHYGEDTEPASIIDYILDEVVNLIGMFIIVTVFFFAPWTLLAVTGVSIACRTYYFWRFLILTVLDAIFGDIPPNKPSPIGPNFGVKGKLSE